MNTKEIKDEYKISEVLSYYGIENEQLLLDIDEHLDKKLTVYLMDDEQKREAVNNEWRCYLYMALRDTEDGSKSDLVARIKYIIDSGKPEKPGE